MLGFSSSTEYNRHVSTNHAYPSTCLFLRRGSVISSPDFSLHQPRGTIMAKRSVQPNLFSFLPLKISDIHTNKVKRSRVDENEEPDDLRSKSEPEFGAEAPPDQHHLSCIIKFGPVCTCALPTVSI